MKYRDVELYYQQALDNVGTKTKDLKTTEPISAMRFSFFGTNGVTNNRSNFINDVITKLELVDGSDHLISLSMKEAQAIQFRRTGKMPYVRPGEAGGGSQEEQVMIFFGRYLWDPEYWMDLKRFLNPQLKVTSNIAAIRGVAADGWADGSLKVTVDLLVMPDVTTPSKGFFMQKNVYGFTSATSGDEHVPMPRDYPYAGLMMRAYVAGNDVDENIEKIKLNCDTDKFVPLEKYVKDLYKNEEEDFGPAEIRYIINRAHDATVAHILNHDPIVSLTPVSAGLIANVGWSWSGRFYLSLLTHAGANQTDAVNILMNVKGSCPHSTIYLPFGLRDDVTTYFNPKDFEDIDLVLTQKAASAVDLVLVQLRSYGAPA